MEGTVQTGNTNFDSTQLQLKIHSRVGEHRRLSFYTGTSVKDKRLFGEQRAIGLCISKLIEFLFGQFSAAIWLND